MTAPRKGTGEGTGKSLEQAAEEFSGTRVIQEGLSRLPLLVVLIGALSWTCYALLECLDLRAGLVGILGTRFWMVVAGLGLSLVFELWILGSFLRAIEGAWLIRSTIFWRLLFCVLVLGQIAFLAANSTFQRVHLDMALGLAGGAFAALLVSCSLALQLLPGALLRGLGIVALQLCVFAVLAEVSLRVWALLAPTPILSMGDAPVRNVIDAYRGAPGSLNYGFPHNSTGHFDVEFVPKAEGEQLILTIGDSFSSGVVPHAYHFTTVCEEELGIQVYNMGVPSVGPGEYLHMLRHEALHLNPDAIVINIFTGNDLSLRSNANRLHGGLRQVFDRGNLMMWVVPQRWMRIRREVRERTPKELPEFEAAYDLEKVQKSYPWLDDPFLEKAFFSESTFLNIEAARAQEVCEQGTVDWDGFFTNLEDMLQSAGDIPIYFMIIPDEMQVEDAVWESVVPQLDGHVLERDLAQRALALGFKQRGMQHLDLLPHLLAVPPLEDGRRHLYHLRDTHFNARGNRVAGLALAAFLAERL